jgi:hypothetical protein
VNTPVEPDFALRSPDLCQFSLFDGKKPCGVQLKWLAVLVRARVYDGWLYCCLLGFMME